MSDTALELGEVTYSRVFDAPRELVFACMTDPKHLTHFWGPTGMSTPLDRITIDLRVGGRFETTMVNDADSTEFSSGGVYTEIDPPSALAWREDNGGLCRTTFTDDGNGGTEVHIHQSNVPAMYVSPQAQAGFTTSLDKFAAYLASQQA